MKTKQGLKLRDVCGENVIIAEGKENIDFNNIIRLNETAAVIWKAVQGKDFTIEDMVAALTIEYEVDKDTATQDCQALLDNWGNAGMLEGVEPKADACKPINLDDQIEKSPVIAQEPEKKESLVGRVLNPIKKIFK